jgi:hypothetical protein
MGCTKYGVQPAALHTSIEVIITCKDDIHKSLEGEYYIVPLAMTGSAKFWRVGF